MKENIVVNHDFQNRLHTVLLLLSLLALLGSPGWLIGGPGAILH